MFCVNVKSKEFKEACSRLNIHPSSLEVIAFQYFNNIDLESFPSDEYIMSQLEGKAMTNASESQILLWEKAYSTPKVFSDRASVGAFIKEASKYFSPESISIYRNNEGQYVARVARPENREAYEKELKHILDNAPRNEQGQLLAPNGKPTKLSEIQYAQVRTKAFKEWFGDWTKITQNEDGTWNIPADISKIIDEETGEPKVVYHGSPNTTFTVFDKEKIGSNTDGGFYGRGFYFSEDKGISNKYGKEREFFLNIKNPYEINPDKIGWEESDRRANIVHNFNAKEPTPYDSELSKYDGVLQTLMENGEVLYMAEIVVPNANQIKSATDNVGTFSTESDDIRFNIQTEEKIYDVLDFLSKTLKDSNGVSLIHKYEGEHYLSKTAFGGMSSVSVGEAYDKIQTQLEYTLTRYNLPINLFNIVQGKSSRRITINNDALKDTIARNETLASLEGSFKSKAEYQKVKSVLGFLANKTGLKYEIISQEKAKELLKSKKIDNVNAFVQGDTCYFIEGRQLNVDIATEEMLHPFVASIRQLNPAAFKSLLRDAQRAFPRLRLEIIRNYKGRPIEEIQEELVTQALSRAFREDIKNTPEGHSVKELIKNFINRIVEIFQSFFGENNSEVITEYKTRVDEILEREEITAQDLQSTITINELAEIVNSGIKMYSPNISGTRMNIEKPGLFGLFGKKEQAKETTKDVGSKEGTIQGKLGVNKEQLISLLGSTMYNSNRQEVAIKELMQNAFDAVKIAKNNGQIDEGIIDVDINYTDRTITVSDNGIGMSPEIVQKAFFTIGGSYKGDNISNSLKSGGLGLAKMAFLFGSEYVEIETVKDGIKTTVRATPDEIKSDSFIINTSKIDKPNGTKVKVKIPESYIDTNGEEKSIWFSNDPMFLNNPMVGDVTVNVKNLWGTKSYNKKELPKEYTALGKATTAFGDIEIYIAEDDSYSINSEILISGLHQFTHRVRDERRRSKFKAIINILPSVGVNDYVYPMNNQREGFRATITPEIEDLNFLLLKINSLLEKKSIAASFNKTVSISAANIAEVKRNAVEKEDIIAEVKKEVIKTFGTPTSTSNSTNPTNSIDLKAVGIERKKAEEEKKRNSSFDASNIDLPEGTVEGQVDTSSLDISKPVFHNNTSMVIEEDGQKVITRLGELMLELKSLYIQTYENAGIKSRYSVDIIEHLKKQYWGISFDKSYGGVNVHPSVMNLLAINPFYKISNYEGVDSAIVLTEYITHLLIHEFNHNYVSGEGSEFTGRFPQTYAEFAGIGDQYNKEWKDKLYSFIKENFKTFVKYAERYDKATNLGDSFKGSNISKGNESQESSAANDGTDVRGDISRENVSENGGEIESIVDYLYSDTPKTGWARTAENNYEVSTAGDRRFSAMVARFNPGTIIEGVDVGGMTIEQVYQSVIKKSRKGQPPAEDSMINRPIIESQLSEEARRDFYSINKEDWSYRIGYLPLWQEWARQNPQLIEELRENSAGKTLTDKFANTRVSQARALAEILNSTRKEESTTTESSSELETRTQNEEFMENNKALITELENLYDLGLTDTDIKTLGTQLMYWISEHLTVLHNTPGELKRVYNIDKDASSMSRKDIAELVTPKRLMEQCIREFRRPKVGMGWKERKMLNKIADNARLLLFLSSNTFTTLEGFSIIMPGADFGIMANIDVTTNEFNGTNEDVEIQEEEGSSEEHWMRANTTITLDERISLDVKTAISKCYRIGKDGKPVISKWGIKERIPYEEARNIIVNICSGCLTLNMMVEALDNAKKDYPWLEQLIVQIKPSENKAENGARTQLQSAFFRDMYMARNAYSIVKKSGKKFESVIVNENTALKEITNSIITEFTIGSHPLFGEELGVTSYNELVRLYNTIKDITEITEENREEIINSLLGIYNHLGFYTINEDLVKSILTIENVKDITSSLKDLLLKIVEGYKAQKETGNKYYPFEYSIGKSAPNSILGNLRAILRIPASRIDNTTAFSVYDNGKMHQSFCTPSYLFKLMTKFQLKDISKFNEFIDNEYKKYQWFAVDVNGKINYRASWLQEMVDDPNTREILKHKIQLNFNKHNYMRNMTSHEYALSVLTEFFSEKSKLKGRDTAWYRVPMLSNKPSSEFIRFVRYTGPMYKTTIIEALYKVYSQELSRIQTVRLRRQNPENVEYISNFDERGLEFCFLTFLNEHLGTSTELGLLMEQRLNGNTEVINQEEKAVKKAIEEWINQRSSEIIATWEDNGILEKAGEIANIGDNKIEVKRNIENFIWNDILASINIQELTITDPALYKDTEDIQKRIAQMHSPGIRPNIEAVDFDGNPVSDGNHRALTFKDPKDFEYVISNVIENITIICDRRIAIAEANLKEGKGTAVEVEEAKAFKELLVGEDGLYRQIEVADAQAYSCATSYRKKAFMFGKWSKSAEAVYKKLINNEYVTLSDIKTAFQPLKPFVYSQIPKSSGVADAPMQTLKTGIQNKNSEYLLVMAEAMLQNEDTGKPNLLRAISEFMEESAERFPTRGIDTVQFGSAVKVGKQVRLIDISKAESVEDAKEIMRSFVYPDYVRGTWDTYVPKDPDNPYTEKVDTMPMEDYSIQQEVPAHFRDHQQVEGSQERAIIPSDLPSVDAEGNPVTFATGYNIDGTPTGHMSSKEFAREWEETHALNIEESIEMIIQELQLDSLSKKDRNIAIARLLQREILANPNRYGTDLLIACSLTDSYDFRVPLGDPIQSKRVEQLLNSVVKNRINKQTIAGGPIVQVSNFGMSRRLSIRFNDRNGNVLDTFEEWSSKKENKGKSIEEYKKYIKENQAGIAYMECMAPAYTKELFANFADENGNIDVEAIEKTSPELLKMIGYRIPTEDKYSITPLKIVGFLPRVAGDGIMLPYDITLINGSDFDVKFIGVIKLC